MQQRRPCLSWGQHQCGFFQFFVVPRHAFVGRSKSWVGEWWKEIDAPLTTKIGMLHHSAASVRRPHERREEQNARIRYQTGQRKKGLSLWIDGAALQRRLLQRALCHSLPDVGSPTPLATPTKTTLTTSVWCVQTYRVGCAEVAPSKGFPKASSARYLGGPEME